MASDLHQQLKSHYVADATRHEVVVDNYRIDAVAESGQLIEVQCAALAAIRDKIRTLVQSREVLVVKPLAARKRITTLDRRNGETLSSRYSPARQTLAHVFQELVHFSVFPHPRLQLDVVLTEQEEIRTPATVRSSWKKKFSVQNRTLVSVQHQFRLRTPQDLWHALDLSVPEEFSTADLTNAGEFPRWLAQKAAWCFRKMEFFEVCGKRGNSVLYRLKRRVGRPRRKAG